jgi:hypothetical protein
MHADPRRGHDDALDAACTLILAGGLPRWFRLQASSSSRHTVAYSARPTATSNLRARMIAAICSAASTLPPGEWMTMGRR